MTDQNKSLNSLSEIRLGDKALAEARSLLAVRHDRGVVGRAYYAAFYYARAVLFSKGLECRTHRGVGHQPWTHFAGPGELPAEATNLLGALATRREVSDYDTDATVTVAHAAQAVADAERFIALCRPLLPKKETKT